jgi:hypothetical protein
MTETTKDKVPPGSSRGKCASRAATDVEGRVLRAHGFAPWDEGKPSQGVWERGDPHTSAGWVVSLWKWEDGSTDLDARLRDRDSGAAVAVDARNIVALFALMERFGDVIWNAPEAG